MKFKRQRSKVTFATNIVFKLANREVSMHPAWTPLQFHFASGPKKLQKNVGAQKLNDTILLPKCTLVGDISCETAMEIPHVAKLFRTGRGIAPGRLPRDA